MAKRYRPVLRDQQFLLPPDMADWLPRDHVAWFVVDVVASLDTAKFHQYARLGGRGRAGYDPEMLLSLLIYGYCHGVRSSRQIERLCGTDVAFRVLCGQDPPDHSTLARFRQGHDSALAGVFEQVLVLCARAGLVRLGTVAIDGTKIAANASPGATRSESALRRLAEEMLADAAAVDAAEDDAFGPARGDELPPSWRDGSGRPARLRAALADIDAERAATQASEDRRRRTASQRRAARSLQRRAGGELTRGPAPASELGVELAQQRVTHAQAVQQDKIDRRERVEAEAAAAGRRPAGRPPVPVEQCIEVRRARQALAATVRRASAGRVHSTGAEPSRNLTDPDSRMMLSRHGWLQGYNAQIAVSGDGMILAAEVSQDANDVQQFTPMLDAVVASVNRLREATDRPDLQIGTVLADAGYLSQRNLTAPGPDRLIAVGTRRDQERDAREHPADAPAAVSPEAREQMRERLRAPDGIALYRRRGATVEPSIGHLKDRRGMRRFSRRGLTAVHSEHRFACAVTNLLKLHQAGWAAAT